MSFYMSFDENDNDRRQIEGGSFSIGGPQGGNFDTSDIKASLDSIRSEHEEHVSPPKKCDDEMDRLLGLWSSRLTVAVPIWMATASEERLRHIDDIEEGLFATMTTLEASHNIEWGDFSPDAVSPDVWEAIVATYRLYSRAAVAGDPPTVQVGGAADSKHIPIEAKGTRADLKDAAKVRLLLTRIGTCMFKDLAPQIAGHVAG
jgi:hypothetical protein